MQWVGRDGRRRPTELTTARGGQAGSLHHGRQRPCWLLVTTRSCFSCPVSSAPLLHLPQAGEGSPTPAQVPSSSMLPWLCLLRHSTAWPGPAPPCSPHSPQTEVCPSLAGHRVASPGGENSRTLYGAKSRLDGRAGGWYARAGGFCRKSCRAKPSPAETLSGRHSNSRREQK